MAMKKYIIILSAAILALSCSKESVEGGAGEGLMRIEATVAGQAVAEVARGAADIVLADPTTSPLSARSELNMVVKIGATTKDYAYGANGWTPSDSDDPIRFAGNGPTAVQITLAQASPLQDGSAAGLLGADALTWSRTGIIPAASLSGVILEHAKTLIEVTLHSTVYVPTLSTIGGAGAYRIPDENVWQAIIEPGSAQANIVLVIDGLNYTFVVVKASVPGGEFKAGFRYRMSVAVAESDIDLELVPGDMYVEQWAAGGSGTATIVD